MKVILANEQTQFDEFRFNAAASNLVNIPKQQNLTEL